MEYRLPTEAEWEYACRAGTETAYSFGDDEASLGNFAWFSENARDVNERFAHAVGMKKPNAFGLHDMHGNVWEWCWDWSGWYENAASVDPKGPSEGSDRVLRGGCWLDPAGNARSAYRFLCVPEDRYDNLGFRVVRSSGGA